MTKQCSTCKKYKSLKDFEPRRRQCRRCRLDYRQCLRRSKLDHFLAKELQYRIKTKYGVTLNKRNLLLERQGGICVGCKGYPTCIDHDHQTGIIRGMLCKSCNLVLGHAYDNPSILRNLATYLENCKENKGEQSAVTN